MNEKKTVNGKGSDNKKSNKSKKQVKKIIGLDIDKMEYQTIVLSHTNFPDRDFKG